MRRFVLQRQVKNVNKLDRGCYTFVYAYDRVHKAKVGVVYICCPICRTKQSLTLEAFARGFLAECPGEGCKINYRIHSQSGAPMMVEFPNEEDG